LLCCHLSSLFPYTTLFRSVFSELLLSELPPDFSDVLTSVFSLALVSDFTSVLVSDLALASDLALPFADSFVFVSAFTSVLTLARSEEHTSELQSPDHLVCR